VAINDGMLAAKDELAESAADSGSVNQRAEVAPR
jgi:hypothetical protein